MAVWWQRIIWELLEIAVQIFIFHIVSVAKQLSDVCAYFSVFRALPMKVFLVLPLCCFLPIRECTFFAFRAGFSIDSVLTDSLRVLCSAFGYSMRMGRGNWFFIIKFSWNEFVYILRWACNERNPNLKNFSDSNCNQTAIPCFSTEVESFENYLQLISIQHFSMDHCVWFAFRVNDFCSEESSRQVRIHNCSHDFFFVRQLFFPNCKMFAVSTLREKESQSQQSRPGERSGALL